MFSDAEAWQQTRLIAYTLYCANTDKKNKQAITEFLPLLTDVRGAKKQVEKIAPEDMEALRDRSKRILQMVKK